MDELMQLKEHLRAIWHWVWLSRLPKDEAEENERVQGWIERLSWLAKCRCQDELELWTEFASWWESKRELITLPEALNLCEWHYIVGDPMPWYYDEEWDPSQVVIWLKEGGNK